jgi:hypothetical protein
MAVIDQEKKNDKASANQTIINISLRGSQGNDKKSQSNKTHSSKESKSRDRGKKNIKKKHPIYEEDS